MYIEQDLESGTAVRGGKFTIGDGEVQLLGHILFQGRPVHRHRARDQSLGLSIDDLTLPP